MKILFTSNHNPHFVNTNIYREKAIKELGHDLIFFEDQDFLIPGRIRQRVDYFEKWDFKRHNKKLAKLVRDEKPDLFLAVGDCRIFLETLSKLKTMGIKTVLWTTDAPRDFTQIMKSAPLYDHIFCAGTETIEILTNRGIKGAIWLPFACDPDYHQPVELTEEEREGYAKDVVFVGAFYPNRWETFKELSEFDIGIWGPGWNRAINKGDEKQYIKDVRLNYSEWVKIYSAAKIVMVIHYQDGKMPCYQASPKVYEAIACRCFVLVDRQPDVLSIFDDKRHLVIFDNLNDLKEKIKYFLEHPAERERIAAQGYRMVLEKHTYTHRIKEMFSVISI